MMNTHPAPGCSTMARGSSRPPDTSTVGARPDRSDTEMVSDPEESRTLDHIIVNVSFLMTFRLYLTKFQPIVLSKIINSTNGCCYVFAILHIIVEESSATQLRMLNSHLTSNPDSVKTTNLVKCSPQLHL